jgi:hypothetical protein
MAFDWRKVVETVVPAAASLFGTPIEGALVGAICNAVLGKPHASDDELNAAIMPSSPDVLARLKEAGVKLVSDLAAAGIKLEEIAAGDRANARDREVKTGDRLTPRILAALVLLSWFGAQFFIFYKVIDPTMRDFAMRILGTLDGALMLVLSYYFGTSASSGEKNAIISKALDK